MAAADAVLRREGRSLAYYGVANGPQGYRPLRDFLAAKLKRDAGIACAADDILLVSGSLQAFDLINGALLARGDTVIVERDTYQGMLNRYARAGVNAVGVPLDDHGLCIDAIEETLRALSAKGIRPKYIYTIPTVQNPTGTIMPVERRTALLALAETYGVPVFEDDCYSDLIWNGERPRDPNAPQLEGTGEITVEGTDRATGYWTTRSDRDPELHARTSGVYLRAKNIVPPSTERMAGRGK